MLLAVPRPPVFFSFTHAREHRYSGDCAAPILCRPDSLLSPHFPFPCWATLLTPECSLSGKVKTLFKGLQMGEKRHPPYSIFKVEHSFTPFSVVVMKRVFTLVSLWTLKKLGFFFLFGLKGEIPVNAIGMKMSSSGCSSLIWGFPAFHVGQNPHI